MCVDGEVVSTTTTGQHRPDVVASMSGDARLATTGFVADVPVGQVPDGPHEFSAVVRDGTGSALAFQRLFHRISAESFYHSYYERTLPTPQDVADAARAISATTSAPRFVLLIDGDADGDIAETIRSIGSQEYAGARCVVLADEARSALFREQLADLDQTLLPITVESSLSVALQPGTNGSPSFVALLQPGETLAPHALTLIAASALDPGVGLIYSDHDVILASGRHVDPSFKPDWSPDHLLSRDYVGPSYLVRDTARLRELLAYAKLPRGPGWRFDILLRLTDEPTRVLHIPRVLWSVPPGRQDPAQDAQESIAAVKAAIERRGYRATVAATDRPGVRRVRWEVADRPKVSIIIPTTGRIEYLRPCLESLRARTSYENCEILIIDNGRGKNRDGIEYARSLGLTVLTSDEPFNWAKLNNDGARTTDGALLLFLNDDIEIVDDEWLPELVSQATRPDVGTVGCMLLYPNRRIQHAGIVLVRHGGGAMHLFQGQDPKSDLYLDLQAVTREVSASTGACLMVARDRFDEAGGFDEALAIVGNDVDLCLRLTGRGYRNIWTPHGVLVHHESVSRGPIAISADERGIWDRWGSLLEKGDPYYNENLDRTRADCSIDWSRVKQRTVQASAEMARGVNLIGYIRAEMGVGEAARGHAHALTRAGVPFTIIDYGSGNPARRGDDSWLHKTTSRATYDTNLIHVNADLIGDAVRDLARDIVDKRYTIGVWAWEMPEFPDEWLGAFDVVDEVWAPSTFIQQAVSGKSPVPVVRVPYAVRTPSAPFLARPDLGLHDAGYVFLAMYDVHSVRERKNPDAAVRAFRAAFTPDDEGVTLVIKVNGAGASDPHSIEEWTEGYPNIRVLDRRMTRHEVDSLLAGSDCFVSLHRSEGFGLPIAEAMGLGKPVIATYWSGNVDFMTPRNAACIDYQLVTLTEDYLPYRAGQRWAEPDVDQAASWMRRLRADEVLAMELGSAARTSIGTLLSPDAVGRVIAERLEHIHARHRTRSVDSDGVN